MHARTRPRPSNPPRSSSFIQRGRSVPQGMIKQDKTRHKRLVELMDTMATGTELKELNSRDTESGQVRLIVNKLANLVMHRYHSQLKKNAKSFSRGAMRVSTIETWNNRLQGDKINVDGDEFAAWRKEYEVTFRDQCEKPAKRQRAEKDGGASSGAAGRGAGGGGDGGGQGGGAKPAAQTIQGFFGKKG